MDVFYYNSIVIGSIFLGCLLVWLFLPRFFSKGCSSKICLVGKTALITGGSLGIGYEIVLGLAQRGCRVIIADKVINKDIKNKIILETNNPEIYMEYVDLGSFKSVRSLAEKLKTSEKKLDILIHNAAIGSCGGALSEDDINLTMQVNYYSPFLLTHLLVDLLKNSPSARLLFCGSPVVWFSRRFFAFSRAVWNTFADYWVSKTFLIVVSDLFAERLKHHGVTSNCFHPGAVNTRLHHQFLGHRLGTFLHGILGPLVFKSPEEGAQTAIYLACSNEVKNVTGEFFCDMKPTKKVKEVENKRFCESLWEVSEEVVKLKKNELL
ncbi:unnamed protein product [Phyllotreta striolata]|uniref:Uncharacterized protein n=1 Tax=Phyllotreta striolata TaxID=444603 RepID=A0A9N9TJ40_PHYSR|nr:unnamed protein product [Phyllotreta striolata]